MAGGVASGARNAVRAVKVAVRRDGCLLGQPSSRLQRVNVLCVASQQQPLVVQQLHESVRRGWAVAAGEELTSKHVERLRLPFEKINVEQLLRRGHSVLLQLGEQPRAGRSEVWDAGGHTNAGATPAGMQVALHARTQSSHRCVRSRSHRCVQVTSVCPGLTLAQDATCEASSKRSNCIKSTQACPGRRARWEAEWRRPNACTCLTRLPHYLVRV
mmetsp:Transcript_40146/g.119640  ORF Transcript_40146/g.119640 Transcript_40146/m.119640 type:complete len:215 (+) Transcript_40146:705-1349(+)